MSVNAAYKPSGVNYAVDFYGSGIYNTLKGYGDNTFNKNFNGRLLSYDVFRPGSYQKGYPTDPRVVSGVKVSIPTQTQILGHEFTRSLTGGTDGYQSQTGYQTQFALYKLAFQETMVRYKDNRTEPITLDSYGPNGSIVGLKTDGGYQTYYYRGGTGASNRWVVTPILVIG